MGRQGKRLRWVELKTRAQWGCTPPSSSSTLSLAGIPRARGTVVPRRCLRNYLFQRAAGRAVVWELWSRGRRLFLYCCTRPPGGGLDRGSRRRRPRSGRAAQPAQPAATEGVMGKEEEIARIARRLDKMVTRKNAVRGAGRQDPGAPLRGDRLNLPSGRMIPSPFTRDPLPMPALHPVLGLPLRNGCHADREPSSVRRPAVSTGVLGPAVVSPVCPHPSEPGFSNKFSPCLVRPQATASRFGQTVEITAPCLAPSQCGLCSPACLPTVVTCVAFREHP